MLPLVAALADVNVRLGMLVNAAESCACAAFLLVPLARGVT